MRDGFDRATLIILFIKRLIPSPAVAVNKYHRTLMNNLQKKKKILKSHFLSRVQETQCGNSFISTAQRFLNRNKSSCRESKKEVLWHSCALWRYLLPLKSGLKVVGEVVVYSRASSSLVEIDKVLMGYCK